MTASIATSKAASDRFDKISMEDQVPPSDLAGLVDQLNRCSTEVEAKALYDRFCARNRLRGRPVELAPNEKLGRLMAMDAFVRRLTRSLNSIGHYVDETDLALMFQQLFDRGSPFEERELLHLLLQDTAANVPITGVIATDAREPYLAHIAWIYRNPNRCTICSRTGIDPPTLPFRLGLQASTGDQYICLDIDAQHLPHARLPTILDTCWDQIPDFVPGGKTRPTGGLPGTDGIEETVAIPPHFRNIETMPVGIVAEVPSL